MFTIQVKYFDVGSPLSNKYYLGFQQGEMYGLEHQMQRFLPEASIQLRAKTDIPGLYLTGNCLHTIKILVTCTSRHHVKSTILDVDHIRLLWSKVERGDSYNEYLWICGSNLQLVIKYIDYVHNI